MWRIKSTTELQYSTNMGKSMPEGNTPLSVSCQYMDRKLDLLHLRHIVDARNVENFMTTYQNIYAALDSGGLGYIERILEKTKLASPAITPQYLQIGQCCDNKR